jgi:superfamily II DNA or RNA helicase
MAALTLKQWKSTGTPVRVLWDESTLTVTPSFRELEKVLTMEVSEMVQDPKTFRWKKATHTEDLYEVAPIHEVPGMHYLRTYQGFLPDIQEVLTTLGVPFQVDDVRLKDFPAPRFDLMHGFRFSQRELLETALRQDRSGLTAAPTRFGKTTLMINTCRAYPQLCTLVVAPGVDLVDQLHTELAQALPQRLVKKMHSKTSTKSISQDVTVISMDSLSSIPDGHVSDVRLILVDEPHALPTAGRMPDFMRFEKARKLGYGATLDGRFDGKDPLIRGLIGPVLSERTYTQAVEEGAISPIVVYMLNIPVKGFPCRDRRKAYQHIFWENEGIANCLRWLCTPSSDVFDPTWQILGFIDNERQAEYLKEFVAIPGMEIAMAKQMTAKQRVSMTDRLKSGETRLCFATNIYAQGVTFSDLRVVINLAGGGASTKTIQKPGRVAELRPGKRCGVVVDFMFSAPAEEMERLRGSDCWCPVYESRTRLKYYRDRGFEVHVVYGQNELRRKLQERCR